MEYGVNFCFSLVFTAKHLDWHENLYPVANNELKLGERLASFFSFIKKVQSLVGKIHSCVFQSTWHCFSIFFPLVRVRPLSKFTRDVFAVSVRAREFLSVLRRLRRRDQPFSLFIMKNRIKQNWDFFTRIRKTAIFPPN